MEEGVPIDRGEREVGLEDLSHSGFFEVESRAVHDKERLEEHFGVDAVLAVGYLEQQHPGIVFGRSVLQEGLH